MVESRSAKHTRTRSHGAHERTSWKAPKSVGGETESTRESTTTTCCPGVRLCSMSMCRGRANHIPAASAVPTLPVSVSISHPTIARHGRHRPSPCTSLCLSACLSLSQAGFHSRVCLASPLSSVFCAAQLHARAHRSGIFRPSSVSSLAVPVDQQPDKKAPYLCSPLELSCTFGVAALNSVSRQTRGKPCALARFRSWNQTSA